MENDCNSLPTQSTQVPTTSQKQPPSWCKWFILAISFIINVLATGITFSFGILFVELLKEFNEEKGRTAAVGTVAIGFMFGIGPLAGSLCKQWGTRTVSVVGSVLTFISLLSSGYASSLNVLYGTYSVLAGIGFGMLNLASMLCVSEHFGRKMALACALTSCGAGVGNLVFPIIINILIENYGWRYMLIILAGIQILAIICSAAMIPQVSDGYNICGCKKQPKSENEKAKTKTPISSLYPNIYAGFKLFFDNTSDRGAVDSVKSTSTVDAEFRVGIDTILNSLGLTTNSPCESSNRLNLPNTCKENGGQVYSGNNNLMNSPKMLNITAESGPIQNIYTIDSSFTSQTTSQEQPPQGLKTLSVVDSCADLNTKQKPLKEKILSCDLFVFRNIKYVILLVSCLLSSTGAGVPPIIVSDYAGSFDVSPERTAILMSVMGVTGTVGRLLAGLASCHSKMNIIVLYTIQMFIAGVATLVTPLLLQYWFTMLSSASFGLFYGVTAGLDPAILAELVGVENMAMGYGFFSLALGIGSGISAQVAGSLRDSTGNYNYSFYVAGILMLLSSICVFLLCMMSRSRSKDLGFKERAQCITLIAYQVLRYRK